MKSIVRTLIWILPAGLAFAALLAGLDTQDSWLRGWLAYSVVLVPGLLALRASWQWAGKGRTLAWIVTLAFLLRLAAGLAFYVLLPVAGHESPVQQEGYFFYDAFRRDHQAWDLALSNQPLWMAFSKSYSTDQYGGLLALSAFVYRYLSPDAHRPLIIMVIAAITAALGVPFLWKASRRVWSERLALVATWIYALYPESILQGGSQMREPFLIAFVAVAYCGIVDWQSSRSRRAWLWTVAGMTGMLLVSPGIALFTMVVLAGWYWLGRRGKRVSWQFVLIAIGIFLVGLLLFVWGITGQIEIAGTSPIMSAIKWFKGAVKWDLYLLSSSSGKVDGLLDQMDPRLHVFFVAGYGIAQPVLPAAVVDRATVLWRVVGILRSAGWYILVPLLIYATSIVIRSPGRRRHQFLIWLSLITWIWVVLSAIRAGGDQWDNPRYRVIMLAWQSILAGYGWVWWRKYRSPWLIRLLAVEAIFLAFFGQWYISRYYRLFGRLYFWTMVAWILGLGAMIFVGGWLWDRWRRGRGHRT